MTLTLSEIKKKIGRNPKSDRDWKDQKKIKKDRKKKCLEMFQNVSK